MLCFHEIQETSLSESVENTDVCTQYVLILTSQNSIHFEIVEGENYEG